MTITPDEISHLVAWYKADAITGLSDGDPIASWLDSSSYGRFVAQTIPGSQPIYKTNVLNGKPVVRFDGVDDYLDGSASHLQPQTTIVVAKSTVVAGTHVMIGGQSSAFNHELFISSNTFRLAIGGEAGLIVGDAVDTNWHVHYGRFDGTSSELRKNGGTAATGMTNTNGRSTNGTRVGWNASSTTGREWSGDMAEIIRYNRVLSDDEIVLLDTYLQDKYGITMADYDASLEGQLFPVGQISSPRGRTVVQRFTTSGTWVKPEGAKACEVIVIAGGGGGGSGRRSASLQLKSGGAGGGGGALSRHLFAAADITSTVAVTIGAGGAGGAAITVNDTNGSTGATGGTSSFGTHLRATGGGLGGGGSTGTPTGGTAGSVGTDVGGAGGNGGVASPAAGANLSTTLGATGGGGAAGINASDVVTPTGAAGGNNVVTSNMAGGAAGTSGGSGGAGPTQALVGQGGGGGGASGSGVSGSGGEGGNYGAGGGGGGASLNGFNSGAGGNGAPGIVVVVSYL